MIEQMELFPRASAKDVNAVKAMLKKYPTMRRRLEVLSRKQELTDDEKEIFDSYIATIENIEISIDSIVDDEIRQIMRYRFIENFPRKSAVIKWTTFTDRTLDRKIIEGIEEMADILKLYGKI
ncbi:hypothetical protein [Paenibacillus aquistagni]|uniref:hypothetical protein n=1 Tax=Paenibacillus aquistagni TaxID=1852522 RepID=UPI00145B8032|nr:hypothetical protein [Paenibacillus aquistagni]NMM52136.1 hypothetical protein [Paenibacillus aquistagni]